MSSSDDDKSSSDNQDQEDSSSQSESESDDDQELLNKVANKISFPALIVDKIFGDDKKCLIESLKESLKVPYI